VFATCAAVVRRLFGQMTNKEKSSVMFSRNTRDSMKGCFLAELSVTQEATTDKYLGLPVHLGRSKSKMFTYLKDRV
jgi:hypothetical protein